MNRRETEPGLHTDLAGTSTYSDYLHLEQLLSAQGGKSSPPHHDELLFIIQHQTSELWMKLLIHELSSAMVHLKEDAIERSLKVFSRVGQIQRLLFEQWSVLETLTPTEYLEFRDSLGRTSGFQSAQYREIEFLFGNKDRQALLPFRHQSELHQRLEKRLVNPSLYDEFLRYLARKGMAVPAEKVERDWSLPYESHSGVTAVFAQIYQDTRNHWGAYEMCEKLVDVEEQFQLWRFRHMKTVERIIGYRPGTGGSSGVAFLRKALDVTFFPELWEVRTVLKPAAVVPPRLSDPSRR